MFDRHVRKLIDPPLNRVGRRLAQLGMTANSMTLIGLVVGILSAIAIAFHLYWLCFVLIALSRLGDGLDGAIARATKKTDCGGYLDISVDFLFYGAVPLGFVLADLSSNGAAGAFLLLTFYFNGATFLGFAILAEKHKMETTARGSKSLYYTGGLLEGTETILFFLALCIWPQHFAIAAVFYGGLCLLTGASRLFLGYEVFGQIETKSNKD